MSSNLDDCEICIICALPIEARAILAAFEVNDEKVDLKKAQGDKNSYMMGKIGSHKVVLVSMPGMGKVAAAATATTLQQSFKKIKLALLVGICGGVPEKVRLGDVIIGKQVVQYDFGRQYETGFERKTNPEDSLGRQPPEIRAFVSKLESNKENLQEKLSEHLAAILPTSGIENIKSLKDDLYPADYWHIHRSSKDCQNGSTPSETSEDANKQCQDNVYACESARDYTCEELKCDTEILDHRMRRREKPLMHFGSIASGDKVIRSATVRDEIAKKDNIIAFDMEAAGVWEYLPCVFIKSVCDYADSHKNKKWQEYAAIVAAASVKAVVAQWNTTKGGLPEYQIKNQWINNDSTKVMFQTDHVINHGTQHFQF
ncbi:hypothetical protein TWF694_006158 [Orbilia ellipsospora]|uniref:Nucleoside phosphorylase domain-containing protein n=1 Tax=Orbilia ellipsospora TaxID=2528407 RepID=A0AAV9WSG7_9PEZI